MGVEATQTGVDWVRSVTRTAAMLTGAAALVCSAVVLGFAVFGEPGADDPSATWLAVALVAFYMLTGVAVSITVTNPGRPAVLSSAALTLGSILLCAGTVVTMPDPGHGHWISHRQSMATFAFGMAAFGGLLLILAEWVVKNGFGERAPASLIVRVCIMSVAFVGIAAAAGTSAAHEMAESANTEASTTSDAVPLADLSDFEHLNSAYPGGGGAVGTPYGLLITSADTLAVTSYDAGSGKKRWEHIRHNRTFAQPPLVSADGREVALVGDRRDAPSGASVIVLDTATGDVLADERYTDEEGRVLAVTAKAIMFQPEKALSTVEAFSYGGDHLWTYTTPERCLVRAMEQAGSRLAASMNCAADDVSADKPRVAGVDESTGRSVWEWQGPSVGEIEPGSLVVDGDRVIADVRQDISDSEGLFAARVFRHDLNALNAADGTLLWRREALDLGSTYAVSCAGTLQIGGGELVMGECHHATLGGQATFDVMAFRLSDGTDAWKGAAPLGFTPGEGVDPGGWFAALPDGRVLMVTDASNDVMKPKCGLFVAVSGDVHELESDNGITDPAWCRAARLQATPNGVSVSFAGKVFSIR